MEETIKNKLITLADDDYRIFTSKLIPHTDNILGVRLPLLKKLAKEIAEGEWKKYLEDRNAEYFEEKLLRGMVIGYIKIDIDEALSYIADFIPEIDNWSVCDSFCTGLKCTNKNKEKVWEFIQSYINSNNEFEIRFGVIMMLKYYIDEKHINRVIILLENIRHEGYYAKMAVAWAIAECFIKFEEKTMEYLGVSNLDIFTYNKALQKIIESYRVNNETKELIRGMKRK